MPMKRPLLGLIATLCFVAVAHAQRGAGRAGPAPHAAPSFQRSPAPAAGFRSAPQTYAPRALTAAPARTNGGVRSYAPSAISIARPAFYRANRSGRPVPGRRRSVFYGPGDGYAGYVGPAYLDYSSPYLDDSTSETAPDPDTTVRPNQDASQDQGPYLDQPPAPHQQGTQPATAPPIPAAEAVILVFKDGHSQQIHNFIATRSFISVIQGQRHYDVAVGDLDMAATLKANRAAGVDFDLPAPPQ